MPHFYSASPAHVGAIDAPEYPVHEGKDQNKLNANYYVFLKKTSLILYQERAEPHKSV